MSLSNQSRTITQYTITIDQGFFSLKLETKDGVDGGGNSDMPTTVTFSPDQSGLGYWGPEDESWSYEPQKLKFHGPLEFDAFRNALRVLSEELTKIYGEVGEGWDASVTVIRTPYRQGE